MEGCKENNNFFFLNMLFNILNFRIKEAADDGVFVHGLFIEGARWGFKEMSIVEQIPKVLVDDYPCIHFIVSCFQNQFSVDFNPPKYFISLIPSIAKASKGLD
jgi:hypothetical protein